MNISATKAERASADLRKLLMAAIAAHITAHNWTQAKVAERVSTTAPRISDLMRGYEDRFSVDSLLAYAFLLDMTLTVTVDGRGFRLNATPGGAYAST